MSTPQIEKIEKQMAVLEERRKKLIAKEVELDKKLHNECNLKLLKAVSKKLGLRWTEINYAGLFAFLNENRDELIRHIKQNRIGARDQQQRLNEIIKEQRS